MENEEQEKTQREPTYGERAVGITFNPGGLPLVNEIKGYSANLIDRLKIAMEKEADGEAKAQYTLAIRKIQEGQMWGVKAATWNLAK